MDIFHKKERAQLVKVVVAMSIVIAILAIVLGYFVWRDSTRVCPVCTQTDSGDQVSVVDSDFDGLDDQSEAKYGTDPKNPDSDGDGYLDGQEVEGGYNPLGVGKLGN